MMKRLIMFMLPLAMPVMAHAQLSLNRDNVDDILKELTNEEKAALIVGTSSKAFDGIGNTSLYVKGAAGTTSKIDRLGITPVVMADGPAGVRIKDRPCTKFPIGTLLSSTWDVDLMEEVGAAIGNEVREYGVDVLLAPGINLQRNPLCGRNFEYYSEDPVLAGEMAAAYIRGVQSCGVGTSLKHFAVNNQELNRLYLDARLSERTLRELYLRNFEIAVRKGKPWTIMTSYNYVNGKYASENDYLVNGILRGEWGYDGAVMTDWGAGYDTKAIVSSGNDMIQPGSEKHFKAIVQGLENGTLSEDAVNSAVRNVLNLILRSPRYSGYEYSNKPDLKHNASVARKAASEGMVLLKNGGGKSCPLPVAEGSRIALFGVASYSFLTGGTGSGDVYGSYTIDLRQGLTDGGYMMDETVDAFYLPYMEYENDRCALIDKENNKRRWIVDAERPLEVVPEDVIASSAKTSDIAFVTFGRVFGEGKDRNYVSSYLLSDEELNLLKAVSDAFRKEGKQVVVILDTGGIVDMSWRNCADGILYSWLPGCEAGHSICDIVSGKVTPSGRLPMSIPMNYSDDPTSESIPQVVTGKFYNYSFFRPTYGDENKRYELPGIDYVDYDEGLLMGYRHYVTRKIKVAYPFGFGLSYTEFKYSGMKVSLTEDGNYKIEITVSNTGKVPGREVVQLYVRKPGRDKERPERELKSFAKTPLLGPGENCRVEMLVESYLLDEWKDGWKRGKGRYKFMAGRNANDIVVTKSVVMR